MFVLGEDGEARPRPRWLGGVVMAVAVIALLVVPGLLNPGVVGQAAPQTAPAPPEIGTCLALSPHSQVEVPCLDRHNAEVIKTWLAGAGPAQNQLPDLFVIPFGSIRHGNFGADQCASSIGGYLGDGTEVAALWRSPPPQVTAQLVVAPPEQSLGDLRWSACVVTAARQQLFFGSIRNALADGAAPLPSAFRTCVILSYFPDSDSCERGHRIEILAEFQPTAQMRAAGSALVGFTASQIQQSCAAFAAASLGTGDPTYAGQLTVGAGRLFDSNGRVVPGNGPSEESIEFQQCFVEVVGPGTLTSTVIGLGGGQLPLN